MTWEGEELSPSWLYLSEVLQFDWQGKVLQVEAMVDARAAHLFEPDKPFPFDKWPEDIPMLYAYVKNGVIGGWSVKLPFDKWDKWYENIPMLEKNGVTVNWSDTYLTLVGDGVFEQFEALKQFGHPSDIRLVFWFD